jgi:hypothetical protein
MSSQAHNEAWPFFSLPNPRMGRGKRGRSAEKFLNNALRLPRRLIPFFSYLK